MPNKNKRSNGKRKQDKVGNRLSVATLGRNPPIERLVSRDTGVFRVSKKITSGAAVSIIPSTGFSTSGLTAGAVLAIVATQTGFELYNTGIGAVPVYTANYPNPSSYTAIFDQYRIMGVEVSMYFSNNTSNVSSVTTAMPMFYSAVDYDGGVSSINQAYAVLGYESSMVHKAGSEGKAIVKRKFIPRVINNTTGNIVTSNTYSILPEGSWIDCASTLTPHWGMLIAYEPEGATQATSIGVLTVICEVLYEYRGSR